MEISIMIPLHFPEKYATVNLPNKSILLFQSWVFIDFGKSAGSVSHAWNKNV